MRTDSKGFDLVGVALYLLVGGALLGGLHQDPADDSAQVEIDGGTLVVAPFEAVDLHLSGVITNTATVSFTDENRNSYSAASGGVSVTSNWTDARRDLEKIGRGLQKRRR